MKEHQDILTLNWTALHLMKINFQGWFRMALPDYSVFLLFCGNTQTSAVQRLNEGIA